MNAELRLARAALSGGVTELGNDTPLLTLYTTRIICDGSVSLHVIAAAKQAKCYAGSATAEVPGELDSVDVSGWHNPADVVNVSGIPEVTKTLGQLGCNQFGIYCLATPRWELNRKIAVGPTWAA